MTAQEFLNRFYKEKYLHDERAQEEAEVFAPAWSIIYERGASRERFVYIAYTDDKWITYVFKVAFQEGLRAAGIIESGKYIESGGFYEFVSVMPTGDAVRIYVFAPDNQTALETALMANINLKGNLVDMNLPMNKACQAGYTGDVDYAKTISLDDTDSLVSYQQGRVDAAREKFERTLRKLCGDQNNK